MAARRRNPNKVKDVLDNNKIYKCFFILILMMNKKGLLSSILWIIILLAMLLFAGIIYKNFHTTCVLDNLKSFSLNMQNCLR